MVPAFTGALGRDVRWTAAGFAARRPINRSRRLTPVAMRCPGPLRPGAASAAPAAMRLVVTSAMLACTGIDVRPDVEEWVVHSCHP